MSLPLARPSISFDEVAGEIRDVLSSGRLTDGPLVLEFERAVARYVGVDHAVATTSATTALHLSLVALGARPATEVLVSDFTFPATANAVVQTGATPVLVDCLPDSFLMDVDHADRLTTKDTVGILPVHPFGQPADLTACTDLAISRGLWLVEDAACALGASFEGRACGAWGRAGCLSFHPRKVITTGEGGMVLTNDSDLASTARRLRSHDATPSDKVGMRFEANGFNYRMTEIQAVLGLAQMRTVDSLLSDRAALAAEYVARLEGVSGVSIPTARGVSSFQSFVVLVEAGIDRDRVIASLINKGIESTLGTYAVHAQEAFRRYGYRPGDLPYSFAAQERSLALPLWPGMTIEAIDRVCEELARSL